MQVALEVSGVLMEMMGEVNGLIIPYVEHPFVDDGDEEYMWCIAPEIWFGPRCDKRNIHALQAFGQFGWGINGVHHYDCGYI